MPDSDVVVCIEGEERDLVGELSYVADHINTTRALDGTQSDEWDGYKARWTYHPDAGVRITFIDSRLTTS